MNELNLTQRVQAKLGETVSFRGLGTTFKVLGKAVNGSVAIVEHTLEAGWLGAPMHKHTFEDETSCVVAGSLSVIQNGKIQTAGPGEYIVKPRGIFHTFWNGGNERAHFIEIISPGHFENYFAEIAQYFPNGKPPEFANLAAAASNYGLEMDMKAAEEIIKHYGLKF